MAGRTKVQSGIITSEGIKEENVPNGVNEGNDNVIVSSAVVDDPAETPVAEVAEEVAQGKQIVYSEGNLNWGGVGILEIGYNLVSDAAAEKWLTLKKVRSATVAEVKEHFGR